MVSSVFKRTDYPTLRDVAYLNQASLGLIGEPAFDAMSGFLDGVGRHGNAYMSDDDEATFLDGLRTRAARLLQAEPEQVAILSSASELLGQIPLIIAPPAGSRILAVSTDFPAVTRPWLRWAEQGGWLVDFVDDSPGSDLTTDLIKRVDRDTSVVAVGSVQYANGTTVDVPRLRAATAAAGAHLVVDATQEAGARSISTRAWGADVVVCSGYKWLGGHGGVAIGVFDRRLLEEPPALPGWMSAPEPFDFDATDFALAPGARRYTESTISYVSVAGLTAAIDQLLGVGFDGIEMAAGGLAVQLIDELRRTGWRPVRGLGDPAACAHIISLARRGADIGAVMQRLRDADIVVSGRGGRLRISIAPYNDDEDISRVARVLGRI